MLFRKDEQRPNMKTSSKHDECMIVPIYIVLILFLFQIICFKTCFLKVITETDKKIDLEFLFCFFFLNCFLFNFGHIFFQPELVRQHHMKNISLYKMLTFTSFILFSESLLCCVNIP